MGRLREKMTSAPTPTKWLKKWFSRHQVASTPDSAHLQTLLDDFLDETEDKQEQRNETSPIMQNLFKFSQQQARDIMIPRKNMVCVLAEDDLYRTMQLVIQSEHSRFPILTEDRDEVLGILLAKDILKYLFSNNYHTNSLKDFDIQKEKRKALVVTESTRLPRLLNRFRTENQHMAIVLDEYGNTSGLVTLEDILEEIVGEIEDEHDLPNPHRNIRKLSDNHWYIRGQTPIAEVSEKLGTNFLPESIIQNDEDNENELLEPVWETLAGMLLYHSESMPREESYLVIANWEFLIKKIDNSRILFVHASKLT